MRIAVNNENTTPPRLLGAGIQKPRFSITMMLHHITTPLCYNCGFYTVRWSVAFLLLLTLLCIDGQTTTMGDGLKHEHVCFKTVTYFYSNPGVSGHTALQFTYINDELQTKQLNLTCGDQNEESFIEVKSVVLSLPSQGDDRYYCGESTENSYMNCKQASQCDCCRRPAERCIHNELLEEYQDCNHKKSCLLTVTSKYLQYCPSKAYPCDGKRCHSRWADVTYACRQRNAIPTQPPMHKEKQVTQPYIIAIVAITSALAVSSFVVLLIIVLRKKREASNNQHLANHPPVGSPVEQPVNYENIDAAEMNHLHQLRDGKDNEKSIYEAIGPNIPEGESTYTLLNAST